MYPPHLSYLKEKGTTWFNPSYGITRFWDEYIKVKKELDGPHDYIWSHRKLKRSKEIYAISIIAKAMEKQSNKPWWIIKPEIDPPDGVIGTITENGSVEEMLVREVEVVEHITGNIIETIKTKLSKKRYESNTILVCYISQGGIFDFKKISENLLKETTSLDHIFLVFPGTEIVNIPKDAEGADLLNAIYKLSLVQIKPTYSYSSIDPTHDCKGWEDSAYFIFNGVGKGKLKPVTLENPPKLFN